MRKEDIDKNLKKQPFQPFRITTTVGETFDVPHPDMMIAGRSAVAIGLPEAGKQGAESIDTIITLSMIHLVKIEDLPQPAKSQNGKKKK